MATASENILPNSGIKGGTFGEGNPPGTSPTIIKSGFESDIK